MKKIKDIVCNSIATAAGKSAEISANSYCTIILYDVKKPKRLKEFKR
ncbi:MAG: cyclic lactone autoinducer peptide [Lachnospiraceae bacterium]|nr:cyclic lactone autoinducer peptide [Lachnospiraceae bacterium]